MQQQPNHWCDINAVSTAQSTRVGNVNSKLTRPSSEGVRIFKLFYLPLCQPFFVSVFALGGKMSNRLEFEEERLKGQTSNFVYK